MPNLTKATAIALGVFIVDAFVLNIGALGLIVLFMVPWMFAKALKVKGDRPLFKRHMTITGFYLASALAVLFSIYINNSIATERAERIISALKSYHAERGEYPEDIYDLIPDYINKIPKAKYSFMNSRFTYSVEDGKHVLSFMVLPPHGRSYYALEDGKWGFMN